MLIKDFPGWLLAGSGYLKDKQLSITADIIFCFNIQRIQCSIHIRPDHQSILTLTSTMREFTNCKKLLSPHFGFQFLILNLQLKQLKKLRLLSCRPFKLTTVALGKAVKSNLTFRKILRLGLNSSGCTDCTDRSNLYNSVNTFIQQKVELERWRKVCKFLLLRCAE